MLRHTEKYVGKFATLCATLPALKGPYCCLSCLSLSLFLSLPLCQSLPKFRALLLVLRPFGQQQEKLINSTFYVCLPGGQISPLSSLSLPFPPRNALNQFHSAHLFCLLLRCVTNNVEIKCYARGDKRRSLLLLFLLLLWKMKPH